ncbi:MULTISPECIES: beta-ketoacyl-[acyl-carrier-protein] synthase family protein [Prevotellaceae]|uniref:3-oxoacyl-(Acyl-carrier-protein) synthase n=1 Tax=Hallella colorans TaxID=1703337 RepID=A0A2U0UK93_9BACT|nr:MULTISPECIES: beta-ketoacyl-[acyl-carrier-protein] synthase family protein [Prevotellaceae]PVX58031.1 3-oxoacyl-(acyl-carrier-protein) synthase [Hallella colorans]
MNIAITGEGIVSAIGLNKQEVLQSLQEGRTGIGEMKYLQSVHHELPVGEVDLSNEQIKEMLGIPSRQMMSRTSLMGMLAIDQALKEAHVDVANMKARKPDGKPLRIVLVSGTTVGGMDITELCFDQLENLTNVEFLQHHDCGKCTQQMADHFGIFDEVTTLSTACSSAANAIMLGARLLKAGEADLVVAGGTEALSRFHLNGFNSLMILDHEPCRPFDTTRAGLNLGEGAAFLVLESEEMAQLRKVTPHAYLTGYGNACDAFHQTASSENGEGAYLAMTEALAMAHLSAKDIQYVNAHGTGTPNNDQSESVSLKRVFGDEMPMVSSTKSFTGHTTSASGSIETVICILAMQHHFVPANLGWKNPMENGILPTMGTQNVDLENVLCNSFGFGGNDSSLVISLHPKESTSTIMRDAKIEVLSKVEITSEEQLMDIRKYVKPLEARRMGKIMKSSLLSSLEALQQAGIEVPDSIITGTAYGCLENSERLMEQIKEEGEGMLKPTFFMQSTHNTIGSNIAIKTHCHGYNVTYTQESHSLEWAIRDAELLLRSGKVKNVLVGCHDESTSLFNTLLKKVGEKPLPSVHSVAMVLSCGE